VSKQAAGLSYAVRFPVPEKYFGQLSLVVAALTVAPPGCVADRGRDAHHVPIRGLIFALAGVGGLLGRMQAPREVQVNEAMVLVGFMFLFTPLVMSFPIMGPGLAFPDAIFEAVSGTGSGQGTLVPTRIQGLSLALTLEPGVLNMGSVFLVL